MKKTKMFRCSLNRTILTKTKSHGQFLSSKEVAMGLFDITNAGLAGLPRNSALGDYDFYIREEYYSSSSPKAYSLHVEKAGAELRITRLADAFTDLQMTETDELVLERVEEDGQRIYFIGKVSKPNVVMVEKYPSDNYNTFVYDQIDLIEKRFKSKGVDTVADTVSDSIDAGDEIRYIISENGKRVLDALSSRAFLDLHQLEDVNKMKELEDAHDKLKAMLNAGNNGLTTTETDEDGNPLYSISQEVKDLIDRIHDFDYGTKKDGGRLDLFTPFWVWDNSYDTEIWPDLLDKRIQGHLHESDGADQKVTFIIRKVGKAQIPCANNFQDKTIYSVSVYRGNEEVRTDDELYSLERKGDQLIMKQKDKKVSAVAFDTEA